MQQPSAAAAAGAAAAALLQKQLAADDAAGTQVVPEEGWSEHQTGDGRKFYYHEETQMCSWEKPEVLMTPEERANDTKWREYKIWDGRAFYHNRETKVSCWSMPPELRKLRGESSGVDDRPLPQTIAEKRRTFWDLMREKGVDEGWTWHGVAEVTRDEALALELSDCVRKQCFAELIGFHLRKKQIDAREKDRNAASALERLIEERFSRPEDMTATYEEAAKVLASEEAWNMIKSDVRRDEVFQTVMERLEEKHKKARMESRPGRIVRLQRLMASDPELKRSRLRWKDATVILARKDEISEEHPPLEAIRIWNSLRDLKPTAEHEAESWASKVPTPEIVKDFRDERRRRDNFTGWLKDLAIQGKISTDSSWAALVAIGKDNAKLEALKDCPGATAMELFDEFQEDLRRDGPEVFLGVVPGTAAASEVVAAADAVQQPRKRQRTGFSEDAPPKEEVIEEDNTNALDALIAGLGGAAATKEAEEKMEPKAEDEKEEEEEDPLMEVVTKAAVEKERKAAAEKVTPLLSKVDLLAKKVDELRAMCRECGLPVSGRKQELVDRLANL